MKKRWRADDGERRRGHPDDAVWLWTLYAELLGPVVAAQWGWDESAQRAQFGIHLPARLFTILGVGPERVAAWKINEGEHALRLDMLLVDRRHQGRGIGTSVLRSLKRAARARGKPIELTVIEANPAAAFYERRDFALVSASNGTRLYSWEPRYDTA